MSTNPAPSTSKTEIELKEANDEDDDIHLDKLVTAEKGIRLANVFGILLIFFYGQFTANAIYSNLIRGTAQWLEHSSYFAIAKVILGILMLSNAVFSVIVISLKVRFSRLLIFISGIILCLLSVIDLVFEIIDFVEKKEKNRFHGNELGSTIAEIVIENLFRTTAIILTFIMQEFIQKFHGFNGYLSVSTQVPKQDAKKDDTKK